MCDCGSTTTQGMGPYATGRALVEFVLRAHGGTVPSPLPNGGLRHDCQKCGQSFVLKMFVKKCLVCGGVHAISPPRADDPGLFSSQETTSFCR